MPLARCCEIGASRFGCENRVYCGRARVTRGRLALIRFNVHYGYCKQVRTTTLNTPVFLFLLIACMCVDGVNAKVVSLDVQSTTLVLAGEPFGDSGAYEKLRGHVRFAWDPEHPHNRVIADISRAPRAADGRVVANANFMVLQPRDPAKRRGTAILEVSNRGSTATLSYFNRADASQNPSDRAHFGTGLLMRLGFTLISLGWQADLPESPGLFRLLAPIARDGSRSLQGLVRSDWTVDRTTYSLELAHRGHLPYSVGDVNHPAHQLTVRDGPHTPRSVVPRTAWHFSRPDGSGPIDRATAIHMGQGFESGKIYELVYLAHSPFVMGAGLAAVRDMMRYAKSAPDTPFKVDRGIALGISQTGRFLRHFLHLGFNVDEAGQRVFDGMLIHTAGAGRGSFNHRFAQASRDAHGYATFLYPTDVFPFSNRSQTDPVSNQHDGLLEKYRDRRDAVPKIMLSNTGYEYWGRAASLIHTDPTATVDIALDENERIYLLSSTQHFLGPIPEAQHRIGLGDTYYSNPLDLLNPLRALLVALSEWVETGREPPKSAYPRLSDATLVPTTELAFPTIDKLPTPATAHHAYRVDYGPRFKEEGIIDYQPPRTGAPFPTLVPQVDAVGNEQAGVRGLELRVPVATYTPWALRLGAPAARRALIDYWGYVIPLARTAAERKSRGDPRPSLDELYGTRERYLSAVQRAADDLVEERFLLAEDREHAIAHAEKLWSWSTAPPK